MEPSEFRRASHAVCEAMAPGWEERNGWMEAAAGSRSYALLAGA